MSRDWRAERNSAMQESEANTEPSYQPYKSVEPIDIENLTRGVEEKIDLQETSTQSTTDVPEPKLVKQKKLKHREVKQETQTGKV